MNQILFNCGNYNNANNYSKNNKKTFFIILFVFFTISTIIFVLYYFLYLYRINNIDNIAKDISNNISNTSNYTTINLITNNISYSIIGTIKIEKLNLEYPIISTIDNDLLKISVCKFFGPNINQPGNLCIAGHNYNNNKFFSNLYKLNINDVIIIKDLSGNFFEYLVYDLLEVDITNVIEIYRDTKDKKELTLITCNNKNNKRLLIKAIEKNKKY